MTDELRDLFKNYRHKNHNDLMTLSLEVGDEELTRILQEAQGRRIIIYNRKEDRFICDPPIYWKYGGPSQDGKSSFKIS